MRLEDIKGQSNLTDYFILISRIGIRQMKAGKAGGLLVVQRQEMHFVERQDWAVWKDNL